MIGWVEAYRVIGAMVPLYFALLLGYAAVRWWKIFTPEQCDAVNRLVAFFALPLFTFEFTLHTDPFQVNYRAIAADVISKGIIITVIAAARFLHKGGDAVSWSITSFSLSTLTNSLVVGVPMARVMYGQWAQQLVVQLSVFQSIVWYTLLLFALEIRKAAIGTYIDDVGENIVVHGQDALPDLQVEILDVETNGAVAVVGAEEGVVALRRSKPSLWMLVKTVAHKLALNPNTYASFVGISWACVTDRYIRAF